MRWRIFQRTALCILCLCLLAACGTAKAPASTPATSGCGSIGKTTQVRATSRLPVVRGDWPLAHGDVERTGAAVATGGSKLSLAWSYCTGGAIFSSPIVHNGIVYVASTAQTLTALSTLSGKQLWQLHTDSAFYSTPVIQNGVLYAFTLSGILYALDAQTGKVHWQASVDTPGAHLWSSPVVTQGLVIVGVASNLNEQPKIAGQVQAFAVQTGKMRWRTWILPQRAPGAGVWSSPAVDVAQGIVYAATGDPDDGVVALAVQDGHVIWHWRSLLHDTGDHDIGSGPTLYRDQQKRLRLTVGGKNGNIYSLDAQTGRVLWQTHVANQIYGSPAFANGTLYVVGVNNQTAVSWALSAQTGKPLWQHAIPVIVYASPVVSGQTVYMAIGNGFVPGDGGVEVVNAANGQLLQYKDLKSGTSSSPAVLASWLFIGSRNGNLYAFTR